MNALVSHAMPALLGLLVKATLLLLAAWAACRLLRRASAATRHLVWAAALGGVLLLPILCLALPRWDIPWSHTPTPAAATPSPAAPVSSPAAFPDESQTIRTQPTQSDPSAPRDAIENASTAPPPFVSSPRPKASRSYPNSLRWAAAGLMTWSLGLLLILGQFLIGLGRISRIGKQATPPDDPMLDAAEEVRRRLGVRPVAFLRAADDSGVPVPVTWGLFRPTVLLPTQSVSWSEECLRAALLHELAHVQRWDWATQVAARLVYALYWWHPLIWLAARQARAESERACDDLVLGTGMKPADYAQRLVEVVRSMPAGASSRTVAIAMAQPSEVEERLQAVLAKGGDRSRLSRRRLALTLTAIVVLLLPLSAMRPVVRAAADRESGPPPQTVVPVGQRTSHGILKFVYLKDVATSTFSRRPLRLDIVSSIDGHASFQLLEVRTGQHFRDSEAVQADFQRLLAQGYGRRAGAAPYRIPLPLSVKVPTREVFFTPAQQQEAKSLEREKKTFLNLLNDSPVIVTDAEVDSAKVRLDRQDPLGPELDLILTPGGAQRMQAFTTSHKGEVMGIFVDGSLVSAPTIWGEIGREGFISGIFRNLAEAKALAKRLNAPSGAEKMSPASDRVLQPNGTQADLESKDVTAITVASGYAATLPNGYTIGIAGLTRAVRAGNGRGTYGSLCWTPNGMPQIGMSQIQPLADFNANLGPWSSQQNNIVALWLTLMHPNPAASNLGISTFYGISDSRGRARFLSGASLIRNEWYPKGVVLPAYFPPGDRTCSVRYGVAAGPWRTTAIVATHLTSATGWVSVELGDKPTVMYQDKDSPNRIERADHFLNATEQLGNVARRAVIVDASGRQTPLRVGVDGRGLPVANLTFRNGSLIAGDSGIALTHVKEILLQTRPYQIVEFRNIYLHPMSVLSKEGAVQQTPNPVATQPTKTPPSKKIVHSPASSSAMTTAAKATTVAHPAQMTPVATDAGITEAQEQLRRVTVGYQNGLNTRSDMADAAIALAEARVRSAVARNEFTGLGPDLDAVVTQQQQLLSDAQARFQAGVSSASDMNKVRADLAEARVRVDLYTILTVRAADLSQMNARYQSGVATPLDVDKASTALQKAQIAFLESGPD